MVLALGATAIVAVALLWELSLPRLRTLLESARATLSSRRARARERAALAQRMSYDPGRERRAEQRARTLLRSCVGEEEWEMYRDLGFIRVWGTQADGPGREGGTGGAAYGYLVYPHRAIIAYLAQTHRLLSEYCVTFPDQ